MASVLIQLKADASKLGIDGYRGMNEAELRAAIANAQGVKSGSTRKAAPSNGSASKTTATKAVSKAAKAAPAKAAPAKATTKATPAKAAAKPVSRTASKGTAAKSAAKPAARKPAGAKSAPAAKTAAKRPTTGTAKARSAGRSSTPGAKTPTRPTRRAAAPSNGEAGRNEVDTRSLDWTLDSGVGERPGPRQEVLKALRKFKGNRAKVLEFLAPRAVELFGKGRDGRRLGKAAAETKLRYVVNRVVFDYAVATGQHEVATNRDGYGQSEKPVNLRRRQDAPPAKAAPKATTAARKPAASASKAKAAPAKRAAAKTAPRAAASKSRTTKPAAKAPARRAAAKPAAKGTARKR